MTNAIDTTNKPQTFKDVAKGRSDILKIDPKDLHIDPEFNVREDTEEYRQHVAWLVSSIRSEGVKEPLKARNHNGRLTVTNGHSRLLAVNILLKEGLEIKTVPVIPEDRYSSDADTALTLITSNSGRPLSTLEIGKVYKRLLAFGWPIEEIAKRSGVTTQTVNRALELRAAPEEIKDMVKTGKVSASLAIDTMRNATSKEAAKQTLQKAQQDAQAKGKDKATKKNIEAVEKKERLTKAKLIEAEPQAEPEEPNDEETEDHQHAQATSESANTSTSTPKVQAIQPKAEKPKQSAKAILKILSDELETASVKINRDKNIAEIVIDVDTWDHIKELLDWQ
jgi:ParB/RepB/Spo0J family partition protein